MLLVSPPFARAGYSSPSDSTAPTAPTISASALSSSAIQITLVTPSTDASGISRYELERSPNGSSSWTQIDDDANFPYTDGGLTSETAYYYRARAVDNASNVGDYSSVVNDTTDEAASTFRGATLPTPPETFDTTYSAPTGNTWTATNTSNNSAAGSGTGNRTGCGVQYALNNCALGDQIVLTAGATYTGTITLPDKGAGTDFIHITTDALPGVGIPMPGSRVSSSDASSMPKIVISDNGNPAITESAGAHHYRFIGIEVRPVSGDFVYNLIDFGSGVSDIDDLPHHIWFDRCYIHGDASVGGRRGVQLDGRYMAVVDSYMEEFKESGADTQCILGYNSPGPYKIVNNYLSAAGENVMFGGADTSITDCSPGDLEMRNNHLYKPTSWIGAGWVVKNLLEFKHMRRALVWNNTLENNWGGDGQNGFSFLITPRNQNGGNTWAQVCDIDFQYNKFINTASGVNILGRDNEYTSQVTERILIRNNLVWANGLNGSTNRMFGINAGPVDVVIDHNTGVTTNTQCFSENNPDADRFVWTNNLMAHGSNGWLGTGTSHPNNTLSTYYANAVMTNNVTWGLQAAGGSTGNWPSGNLFPTNTAAVDFVDYAGGDYALDADSPYKSIGLDGDGDPDGTDAGVMDFSVVGVQ